MAAKILSTDAFEKKVRMGIPMDEVDTPPDLREYQGRPFVCGCGGTHPFRDSDTPAFLDLGLFKICVVAKTCSWLNTIQLKGLFSSQIKTLYSCKWERDKDRYGFRGEHPKFDEVIDRHL